MEETQPQEQQEQQERSEEQPRTEAQVPSSRLREETRKRQEAEKKLQELEGERTQQEEQQAQQQGQYQELATKRQEKIQKLEGRIKELEASITRDVRFRTFSRASQGVVLQDAIEDAFSMISEDEFKSADTEDDNSYRMLAQQLAERKPYLADSVRGAGSGGSSRPISQSSPSGTRPPTIAELNRKKRVNSFR